MKRAWLGVFLVGLGFALMGLLAMVGETRLNQSADPIEEHLAKMTIEEKVGQLLMIGINGQSLSTATVGVLEDLKPGGVIFFASNLASPAQIRRFTTDLQEAVISRYGLPLLIASDEEGGMVSRFPAGHVTQPGNMALGATGNLELAQQAALVTAQQMRAVGINVNFGPVVDVNNNPENPVIALRSFGEDPQAVAQMGVAQIRGYQAGGVAATVKHFPGHGDTRQDSHYILPVLPLERQRLDQVELVPFKAAVDAGVDMIMTAHIHFPHLSARPATLAPEIITGILREQWGYTGVVVTDDLIMKAISDNYGMAQAGVLAFEAGADILLVSGDLARQRAIRDAVAEAVRSGRIPQSRLDDSVRRILLLKEKLGLLSQGEKKSPELDPVITQAEAVARQVAEESMTLLRNQGVLPLTKTGQILLIAPNDLTTYGAQKEQVAMVLHQAVLERNQNLRLSVIPLSPNESQMNAVLKQAAGAEVIILTTRNAYRNRAQQDLIARLVRTGKPVVILALNNPYDFEVHQGAAAYLNLYGTTLWSLQAAVRVLFGEADAYGRMPVSVPGKAEIGAGQNQ